MNHVRIGIYTLSGNLNEVIRVATEGMLPRFQRQPGFIDYELVAADGQVISISTWRSKEHADEGAVTAAAFVAEHLGSQVTLDQHFVGDVALSSRTS